MSKAETIADIVAEMRELAEKIRYDTTSLEESEEVVNLEFNANRIEAAWKREKAELEALALSVGGMVEASRHKQVGNTAATREALEAFVEYSELVCRMGMFNRDRLVAITTKARDALSAPPRNCGRFQTKDAAREAFQKLRKHRVWADVSLWDDRDEIELFLDWLFAPAAERKGETDGSK